MRGKLQAHFRYNIDLIIIRVYLLGPETVVCNLIILNLYFQEIHKVEFPTIPNSLELSRDGAMITVTHGECLNCHKFLYDTYLR